MGKRVILAITLAAVFSLGSSSSPCMAEEEYLDIVTKFFEILEEQKPGPAIDYVFSSSPWAEDQKGQVAQVKFQYAALEPMVGTLLDHDIYTNEGILDRYAYVIVLAAYEKQPVKLEFHFYKAKDKWAVTNFNFNTDYISLIQARTFMGLCEGESQ